MWMPERLKVWQVLFLVLPLLAWLAYSSYVDFTHLEEEGGVLYVGRTTKVLYDLGGKWAVVGFPIVAAGIWGYAIWKTLKLSKRADELRDIAEAQEAAPPVAAAAPEMKKAPPTEGRKPPRDSRPPTSGVRPPSSSGPLKPLAAAAPPPPVRAEDAPPDPSGPKLLR